eukprot:15241780-Ditylum_brightwellii.AAC.1
MPFLKNDGPVKYAQEYTRDVKVVCADKSTALNKKKMHPNPKNQREEGSIEEDDETAATRKENSVAGASLKKKRDVQFCHHQKRGTCAICKT